MYKFCRNVTAVLALIFIASLLAGGYETNDLPTVITVTSFYAAVLFAIFTVLAKAAIQRPSAQRKEKIMKE